MEKEINLDEILRKMGLISCEVLLKKTQNPDIQNRLQSLKERLKHANGLEIRAISYELQDIKAAQRAF